MVSYLEVLWRRRPARRRRRRSGNASAIAPTHRGDCVHGPLTSVQRPGEVRGSPLARGAEFGTRTWFTCGLVLANAGSGGVDPDCDQLDLAGRALGILRIIWPRPRSAPRS